MEERGSKGKREPRKKKENERGSGRMRLKLFQSDGTKK